MYQADDYNSEAEEWMRQLMFGLGDAANPNSESVSYLLNLLRDKVKTLLVELCKTRNIRSITEMSLANYLRDYPLALESLMKSVRVQDAMRETSMTSNAKNTSVDADGNSVESPARRHRVLRRVYAEYQREKEELGQSSGAKQVMEIDTTNVSRLKRLERYTRQMSAPQYQRYAKARTHNGSMFRRPKMFSKWLLNQNEKGEEDQEIGDCEGHNDGEGSKAVERTSRQSKRESRRSSGSEREVGTQSQGRGEDGGPSKIPRLFLRSDATISDGCIVRDEDNRPVKVHIVDIDAEDDDPAPSGVGGEADKQLTHIPVDGDDQGVDSPAAAEEDAESMSTDPAPNLVLDTEAAAATEPEVRMGCLEMDAHCSNARVATSETGKPKDVADLVGDSEGLKANEDSAGDAFIDASPLECVYRMEAAESTVNKAEQTEDMETCNSSQTVVDPSDRSVGNPPETVVDHEDRSNTTNLLKTLVDHVDPSESSLAISSQSVDRMDHPDSSLAKPLQMDVDSNENRTASVSRESHSSKHRLEQELFGNDISDVDDDVQVIDVQPPRHTACRPFVDSDEEIKVEMDDDEFTHIKNAGRRRAIHSDSESSSVPNDVTTASPEPGVHSASRSPRRRLQTFDSETEEEEVLPLAEGVSRLRRKALPKGAKPVKKPASAVGQLPSELLPSPRALRSSARLAAALAMKKEGDSEEPPETERNAGNEENDEEESEDEEDFSSDDETSDNANADGDGGENRSSPGRQTPQRKRARFRKRKPEVDPRKLRVSQTAEMMLYTIGCDYIGRIIDRVFDQRTTCWSKKAVEEVSLFHVQIQKHELESAVAAVDFLGPRMELKSDGAEKQTEEGQELRDPGGRKEAASVQQNSSIGKGPPSSPSKRVSFTTSSLTEPERETELRKLCLTKDVSVSISRVNDIPPNHSSSSSPEAVSKSPCVPRSTQESELSMADSSLTFGDLSGLSLDASQDDKPLHKRRDTVLATLRAETEMVKRLANVKGALGPASQLGGSDVEQKTEALECPVTDTILRAVAERLPEADAHLQKVCEREDRSIQPMIATALVSLPSSSRVALCQVLRDLACNPNSTPGAVYKVLDRLNGLPNKLARIRLVDAMVEMTKKKKKADENCGPTQ